MLAGWLGYSACTILNSGYDANLAFLIFSKIQIVSCFQIKKIMRVLFGIKLSGLEKVIYKHLDIADLAKKG